LYGVTGQSDIVILSIWTIDYLFCDQSTPKDNEINEDAGVEMLTDVTPVGRAAGQLYTGQNVSCILNYDRIT
jgi:hypothetical protein